MVDTNIWQMLMQRLGMSGDNYDINTNVPPDGIRNPWNMANLPNTPGATSSPGMGLSPTGAFLTTPQGQAQQAAAGNPNMAPMDVVKETPESIMDNATALNNFGERLGDLGKTLGDASSGAAQQPYVPPVPPPPNYGNNSGPRSSGLGGLLGAGQLQNLQLPNNVVGPPLGPPGAAINPLMMLLKQRLGIA